MSDSIYTIAVISDVHVDVKSAGLAKETEKLRVCLGNMNVDAVAVCGDTSENTITEELDVFYDIFSKHCPCKALFIVPGNMDGAYTPEGQSAYFKSYERYSGSKISALYSERKAESCHMIGISPEPFCNGAITDEQLAFLDGALQNAARRNVPALVFSHFQLTETLDSCWSYAALNADSPKIKRIFEKHGGKIVFFSGHTHRGLTLKEGGSVITKGNVTYVSTPALRNPDNEHYAADNCNAGTGLIVEIRGGNVHITGHDFLNDERLGLFCWIA